MDSRERTTEAVNALLSQGTTKREAFEQVAARQQRTPSAVAQAYYLATRESRVFPRGSKQGKPRSRAKAPSLAKQLQELVERVARLEAENEALAMKARRYDEIRAVATNHAKGPHVPSL